MQSRTGTQNKRTCALPACSIYRRRFKPGRNRRAKLALRQPADSASCHSSLVTAFEICSSSQPALPITDAGECGRPYRWSEGCAPLVTVLPPFLLVTRHLSLVTAFEIASSSNPALPITDAGECGRPDRWSEGCAPLVAVLPPFLLVTGHFSLVTVLPPSARKMAFGVGRISAHAARSTAEQHSAPALVRFGDYAAKWIVPPNLTSGWPTIWIQLHEAAGGRSERVAIQGNRAS